MEFQQRITNISLQIKNNVIKEVYFTSRPFQPKAGLPRGGGVKKTLYL